MSEERKTKTAINNTQYNTRYRTYAGPYRTQCRINTGKTIEDATIKEQSAVITLA